jgi:hypothetical protein
MGCSVSGTGVKGNGTATCAAIAVSSARNTTAATRIARDTSA